jgi:hypothetical protein
VGLDGCGKDCVSGVHTANNEQRKPFCRELASVSKRHKSDSHHCASRKKIMTLKSSDNGADNESLV